MKRIRIVNENQETLFTIDERSTLKIGQRFRAIRIDREGTIMLKPKRPNVFRNKTVWADFKKEMCEDETDWDNMENRGNEW